jgi:superfamily II DNA/RNA helicase
MPRSLILAPTRELAAQCAASFEKYGINHKLNVALLIGGVSMDEQVKKLDRGVDVLIATPGRLLDHFQRGRIMLMGVEILVIDEADRMLDMGFIPDIEKICKLLPPKRQTLFFSATMPAEITRLVNTFLTDPVRVEVAKPATTAKTITQRFNYCASGEDWAKRDMLRQMIGSENVKNAIIFCNRKRDVAILLKSLLKHGFNAGALHGDMDQSARTATLDKFRSGDIQLLAASDVAARGLDIPDVSHIFNFDLPWQPDDYVHRIGRTGRAGKEGKSFSIVTPDELKSLKDIEKMLGEPVVWIGDGPSEEDFADAGKRRRGRGRGAAREGSRGAAREGSRGAARDGSRGAARDGSRGAPRDGGRGAPREESRGAPSETGERGAMRNTPRRDRPRPEREAAASGDATGKTRLPQAQNRGGESQQHGEQRSDRQREHAPGQGPQPSVEAGGAGREQQRQPQRQQRRDHAPASRERHSEPQRSSPSKDTPAGQRAQPGAARERPARSGEPPAGGFADNVPAFLRRPPRPAKVASE